MRFIEEVVVDEFLPTFRSMLAAALRERGLTQRAVADALGISQSAVSKYAHGEVTCREEFLEHEQVSAVVEEIAQGLSSGEMSRVSALVEAEVLIRELERGGVLSQLHEQAMPELAEYGGTIRIHDPDSQVRTAEQVLSSIRRGLKTLEHTTGFTALIPAVGSNLCESLPETEGIEDVAGVPGRIVDVKGRPTMAGEPEFAVSEHVARVLLATRRVAPSVRGCLNVAYDPTFLEALAGHGIESVEFDADGDLEASVEAAMAENPAARAIYQTGGFGIEPIVYVLGDDAASVARIVREVA